MKKIKFGTDGWRAEIAKDYTFDSLRLVSEAAAQVMREKLPDRGEIAIGYDRRFLSREFAELVSVVFCDAGYKVWLTNEFAPTPVLSWAAKVKKNLAGAVVITASHNPPNWNGFKFKEIFGGSALPSLTEAFEEKISSLKLQENGFDRDLFLDRLEKKKIEEIDYIPEYTKAMLKHLDLDTLKRFKGKVGLDVMHGSASKHYLQILRDLGIEAVELHGDSNPGFRGVPPEPIGQNLPELCDLIKKEGLACGLATDGDSDRLGAVDETGEPFTTQQILSTVYWHMLENRGKSWSISRSASTTKMVDLLAKEFNQTCIETPVGFKHIAEKMIQGKAQIGGEESGGIGIMDHVPDRDGILTGLLLLEIQAHYGKGLRAIYEDLCEKIRPYFFTRLDLHITKDQMSHALEKLEKQAPDTWLGREVDELSRMDGFKFYLKDGGWILIRPSGTEPIFRLYAEAETLLASQELVAAAREFVETP